MKRNDYLYVKIRGRWYHLQYLAQDLHYDGGQHSLSKLSAIAYLSGGMTNNINKVVDVAPVGVDGPAQPGWLLPYVSPSHYSPKMLGAMLTRLEQLGMPVGRISKTLAEKVNRK